MQLGDKTKEGVLDYSYEQQKEKIYQIIYQATTKMALKTILENDLEMDYSELPAYINNVLNESEQFTSEKVEEQSTDTIHVYRVKTIKNNNDGYNITFLLKINIENGSSELEIE